MPKTPREERGRDEEEEAEDRSEERGTDDDAVCASPQGPNDHS